jgi:hypothetical protein
MWCLQSRVQLIITDPTAREVPKTVKFVEDASMIIRKLIWAFVIASGVAAVLVCGAWTWVESRSLDVAYLEYMHKFNSGADLRQLTVAASLVEMHRINGAADGVGFMLGAILAALGFLGWYQSVPVARDPDTNRS